MNAKIVLLPRRGKPAFGFGRLLVNIKYMAEKNIEHTATVIFIDGDRIDLEMKVDSACSSCGARKACGMGESKDKIVSLLTQSAGQYEVGEEVKVYIEQRMGIKAATYAYIFPFFVMLVVLLAMFEFGASETVAGLSALGSLAVYYIVLSLFRKRIDKEIIFKLAKL